MRTIQLGQLTATVAGGTDREGGGDGPVVVLLHGYGAPGTDLVPLWRVLDVPAGTRFVFPAAPLTLDLPGFMGESRAWWHIDVGRFEAALRDDRLDELVREEPAGMDAAREAVMSLLDAIPGTLGASTTAPVLGGFSQGAMLSMDVALRTEIPLSGVALMSGALVAAEQWMPRFGERGGMPVLQSHGRQDPLLPYAVAELLRDMLVKAGWQHTWMPFNGGHEIPVAVLDGLGQLVRSACGEVEA